MRSHIVSYCFLLDIAYLEFSDTDGELDDCDEDNRVVEGDEKNILVMEQNYVKFNYMVSQFLFLPLFSKENPFFLWVSESQWIWDNKSGFPPVNSARENASLENQVYKFNSVYTSWIENLMHYHSWVCIKDWEVVEVSLPPPLCVCLGRPRPKLVWTTLIVG